MWQFHICVWESYLDATPYLGLYQAFCYPCKSQIPVSPSRRAEIVCALYIQSFLTKQVPVMQSVLPLSSDKLPARTRRICWDRLAHCELVLFQSSCSSCNVSSQAYGLSCVAHLYASCAEVLKHLIDCSQLQRSTCKPPAEAASGRLVDSPVLAVSVILPEVAHF